jgi:hypothetical protein
LLNSHQNLLNLQLKEELIVVQRSNFGDKITFVIWSVLDYFRLYVYFILIWHFDP